MSNRVLSVAAAAEAGAGIALLAVPSFVVWQLLGDDIQGSPVVIARIAGVALVALSIACWPSASNARSESRKYGGLLAYNMLAGGCLAQAGLAGPSAGALLWPAVILHLALALILAWSWRGSRRSSNRAT